MLRKTRMFKKSIFEYQQFISTTAYSTDIRRKLLMTHVKRERFRKCDENRKTIKSIQFVKCEFQT